MTKDILFMGEAAERVSGWWNTDNNKYDCREIMTKDILFMGEAACRRPRERHSPGPNLALNGPVYN